MLYNSFRYSDIENAFQDYGFDYSDDDDEANNAGSADVENLYYTAKCTVSDTACAA